MSRVSVFVGDITEAPAEAICTSTNPRLSLMMGSGGAVRDRGGFEVLRECEAILAAERERTGRPQLAAGSVHVTTAGKLPYRAVIHCVASDATHLSSSEVVKACVRNALSAAVALDVGCLAMPVFATGHARLKFDRALTAMSEALRDAPIDVVVVVYDSERAEKVRRMLGVSS